MDDLREQLKALINNLPKLFGRLKELLLSSSPLYNEVLQLQARFEKNNIDRGLNLISAEQSDIALANVRNASLELIDRIGPKDLKEAPGTAKGLGDHHVHTCDRVDQSDHFTKIFSQKKDCKAHFLYLYGLDLQSHRGIFKRIAFDLEGRLQDYLSQGQESSRHSLQVELTFDVSRDLEIYKQNILKSLFAALGVRVNEHEPLTQKNITWLRENSPKLQGLGGQDFVCIFVAISEWDWDKDITPDVTRWFINQFCAAELPADSPTYLFFFGIIYEEDDSPIEGEVRAFIEQSEHVEALPELNMVGRRDIGAWFNKYSFIAPGARELKELRETHFSQTPEHYMDDVERKLRQVIDEYNARFF